LQEAFVDSANGLAQDERDDLILKLAQILKTQTGQKHFEHVEDLSGFVLKIAPDNGHGLYFSGEMCRIRSFSESTSRSARDREQMRGQFDRYLSVERTLRSDERNGTGDNCYKRPGGFCAERTAWVNHLMANDFFDQASKSTDRQRATSALKSTCSYLKASLNIITQLGNQDKFPPEGFHQYTSLRSTQDLHDKLQRELAIRGEQACQ
jgi:hypothetical protein